MERGEVTLRRDHESLVRSELATWSEVRKELAVEKEEEEKEEKEEVRFCIVPGVAAYYIL